ncbi:MAG TPA: hypothetical protein VNJ05_08930 [Sphingomicrobium sp.]|nr:hypothetical protein [Sphingomicrobium sp.]
MSKLSVMLGTAAVAAAALAAPSAPAQSQSTRVNEIIVYGTDPCPRSTDDEIVVCARKPESERYRIPERLRQGGSLQSRQAWAARAKQFEVVGRTGINSCSPVGPGGFTGCTEQLIKQAFTEREEQVSSETAPRP